MDDVFHSRASAYVLMGTFVIATMIVYGAVARPWAYKRVNDQGALGAIARGIVVNTG
jgi:hypothetical protein